MSLRTNWIVSVCFLVAGIACALAFNWIGSEVGEDGMLHEPFPLIPIGYFLFTVGVGFALVALVRVIMRRMSNNS